MRDNVGRHLVAAMRTIGFNQPIPRILPNLLDKTNGLRGVGRIDVSVVSSKRIHLATLMKHQILIPMALACAGLSVQAQAQSQPACDTLPKAASLVGLSDIAAAASLRSADWALLRQATTGVRGWSEWINAKSMRAITLENINGTIVSATDELLPGRFSKADRTSKP